MTKRKIIYLLMASIMLTKPVIQLINNENISYAAEEKTNISIAEISNLFKEKRENVDYTKYLNILKEEFENKKDKSTSEEFFLISDLLTKATIETLDKSEIKSLIDNLKNLNINNNVDAQLRNYANIIKLYRSLGDVEKANNIQKEAEKIQGMPKNKINLARIYFNQAHGDVVDIKMKKSTVENLEKAIKLLEGVNNTHSKELLILAYIDLSQVELYFNKDAAKTVELLEKASRIAYEWNDAYFINVIGELESHTLPFYLKYEEGIEALRPVIKFFEDNGYYSEAYRAQHKLVTMMFDIGSPDAIEEGKKLEELLNKIKNPSKKKYYEEYSQSLYLANFNAVNGTFKDGIKILESKDFKKYDHIYSIDYSVTNMYLGNLYSAIEEPEKSLKHFELMMKAIVENSNDNAFVYTDTTSYLGQAYYNLGMYKEGYEVLQKHITDFVNYDMTVNKRNTEELNKKYDLERKNAQLLELELKHEKEGYKTKLFIVISSALTITIGVLILEGRKINKFNKKLAKLSVTDSLTGLANRRSLDEFLATQSNLLLQLNKGDESTVNISAIMIDIDFFKKYNDNYGHVKGDKILQEVGELLSEFKAGEGDVVARYGGEEFAIILTNTDKAEALNIAAKIKSKLAEASIPHEFSEVSDIVTTSIGVSTKNVLTDSLDTLIEDADKALYYSKTHGRNTFTHYDDCK